MHINSQPFWQKYLKYLWTKWLLFNSIVAMKKNLCILWHSTPTISPGLAAGQHSTMICPATHRVVVPAGDIHDLNISDRCRVAILAALHKDGHPTGSTLVLEGQFVAGDEELSVSVVAKLSILWQTKWVQVTLLVHDHAELSTTSDLRRCVMFM